MNAFDPKKVLMDAIMEIAPEADFETLDADDGLREQLDLDSMDFLNIMITLHEKHGIDIPEADYPQLFTLNSALDYLRDKVSPAQN